MEEPTKVLDSVLKGLTTKCRPPPGPADKIYLFNIYVGSVLVKPQSNIYMYIHIEIKLISNQLNQYTTTVLKPFDNVVNHGDLH